MNKSLWFVFMIVLARMLGSKDFGYFSFAFAFASIFAAFTDLGTNTLILKDISNNPLRTSSHINNILALKTILSLMVFIAILLYSVFSPSVDFIVILFSISLIISSFLDPFNSLFRAHKQMHYESLVMFTWRLLIVAASSFTLYYFHAGLHVIATIFIGAAVTSLVLSFIIGKHTYDLRMETLNPGIWVSLLKASIPFGLVIISGTLIMRFNTVLLQHFRGAEEVGWYSAAYRLIEGSLFIPSIFVASVAPFLFQHFSSLRLHKRIFEKALAVLLVISSVIATVLYLFADNIIGVIYGKQFSNSVAPLRITSLAIVFIYCNELLLYFFLSREKHYSMVWTYIVTIIVYAAICLILIPAYGFIGASWSLFAIEALIFVAFLIMLAWDGKKQSQ